MALPVSLSAKAPPPLFPPLHYGAVEDGLYRSALPTNINYPFLKTLNIKTFVILSPDAVGEEFVMFLDECSINAIFIEDKSTDITKYGPIAEDTVIQALNIILDKSNYPVYVACKYGKLLTGIFKT